MGSTSGCVVETFVRRRELCAEQLGGGEIETIVDLRAVQLGSQLPCADEECTRGGETHRHREEQIACRHCVFGVEVGSNDHASKRGYTLEGQKRRRNDPHAKTSPRSPKSSGPFAIFLFDDEFEGDACVDTRLLCRQRFAP